MCSITGNHRVYTYRVPGQAFWPVVRLGPLPRKRVCLPHIRVLGGDTPDCEGGAGEPIPTKGQEIWYSMYNIIPLRRELKYTVKKENKILLIYKEIQMGAVAKSYMRKAFQI